MHSLVDDWKPRPCTSRPGNRGGLSSLSAYPTRGYEMLDWSSSCEKLRFLFSRFCRLAHRMKLKLRRLADAGK